MYGFKDFIERKQNEIWFNGFAKGTIFGICTVSAFLYFKNYYEKLN